MKGIVYYMSLKKRQCLTEQQKDIIKKNHNLIYKFIHKRSLNVDDYYGIAAMGLCNAAVAFDSNANTKFSTLAYKCMENELIDFKKKECSKKRIPSNKIFSYDSPCNANANDDGGDSLMDEIAALNIWGNTPDSYKATPEEIVMTRLKYEDMINGLSDRERMIVKLSYVGMNQEQMAEKIGCKQQMVSYYLKRIRRKVANWI